MLEHGPISSGIHRFSHNARHQVIAGRASGRNLGRGRDLELSPTVISRHLKRLIDQGIVEIAPVENGSTCTAHKQKMVIERSTKGREILYRLTRPTSADMHTDVLVTKLLLRYKTGLPDDAVKSVLELINNVNLKTKMPKKIKHNEDIDQFIKIFYETFPHPYHA